MIKYIIFIFIFSLCTTHSAEKPNIIFIMADDMGWGDVGYNGNTVIKTPALDQMSKEGLKFNRFYSASCVCSPTRASCLTGRNPFRTGVFAANVGILRTEEVTLPEILKEHGYVSGHFGKWHLGSLTHTENDANRGKPGNLADYNPPSLHGYDDAFVTESKVPTYDPMKVPVKFDKKKGESEKHCWEYIKEGQDFKHYGTHYWDIKGNKVTENLDGDDSRVIMDRVLPFIDNAVQQKKPFLSVVWFHAPHWPCVAGPKHQEMYKDQNPQMRNYAGCISALDEQVARLRDHLKKLNIADNTMVWFCSDNGPIGRGNYGSSGDFKGNKFSLFEGGIRVPGILVWPAKMKSPGQVDIPCVTSDYLPTVLDILGVSHPKPEHTLDGISLLPLIEGKMQTRPGDIGHMYNKKLTYCNGQYKLVTNDGGNSYELYDLLSDPGEKINMAATYPEIVAEMKIKAVDWYKTTKLSFEGKDYKSFTEKLKQRWRGPLGVK